MSKTSSAVKNRYNRKAYDRISLYAPKGKKAALQAIAAESGESLNGYIATSILARIGVDRWEDVPDASETCGTGPGSAAPSEATEA